MDRVHIIPATTADIAVIGQLAVDSWWPAYGSYLPHGQIRLMLENMYSEDALKQQLAEGHHFLLAYHTGQPVGFAGLHRTEGCGQHLVRVEKLYILPSEQGKGIGRLLLDEAAEYACMHGAGCLELHVNRNNPAKRFYEKQGFTVIKTVDIPYHGYVLNDYVMRKTIAK